MCFNIEGKNEGKKIAQKDIICYKLFGETPTGLPKSPIMEFRYTIGKMVKRNIGKPCYGEIRRGLHSYSTHKIATERRGIFWGEHLYRAIIPQGSEYYYNSEDEEYVSNQIIIKEKT